jgi:predicted aldo/keto reductase-like oxidoreductase
MNRREFMKGAVVGAAGIGAAGAGAFAEDTAPVGSATGATPLLRRDLGKTGFRPTIFGFGGYPISEGDPKTGADAIHAALEGGVNYFDTASTYGDHVSERYLGTVLPSVERGSFFLTTKTLQRDRAHAEKEIAASFKALKIQPDLLQIHAVNSVKVLDEVMRKGGSFEAAKAAKERGDVRFLGITGHTHPEAIIEALERYPSTPCSFPSARPTTSCGASSP